MKILVHFLIGAAAVIGSMFLVVGWVGWREHPVVACLACLGMYAGFQMLSSRFLSPRPGKMASTAAVYAAVYCGLGFIAFRLIGIEGQPVLSTAVFLIAPPVLILLFLVLCVKLAQKRLDAEYDRIYAQGMNMDAKGNPIRPAGSDAAELERVKNMVRTIAGKPAGEARL